MKFILAIAIFSFSLAAASQSYLKNGKYNRIGLQGKYALLTIDSDQVPITGEEGFQGGLSTRGRLYNNWGVVYGIDFLSTRAQVATTGASLQERVTAFRVQGAQLNLLASYHILGQNLSFEIGPALLINGRMALENRSDENNIVAGFSSLTAGQLQEVSRVNFFGVIGITGGFENFRLTLQYQYGITNFFGNYNNQDFIDPAASTTDFRGTASIISGGIVFYL